MPKISDALILWYNHHQRDLPWRNTHDPYLIWVSEIILQQTQVATGLDYYLRITKKYPTIASMAVASEDDVLKMWQGLGYYSRARNMLATAKIIVDNYQGQFPCDYPGLLKLKGIGPYTASAIASFAFHLPHAVVDGNVARVLTRLFAMAEPIDSINGKKELDRLAHSIMDVKQPGIHNQAIMELGALVCRPLSPQCSSCPLNKMCQANSRGTQELFPVKNKRVAVRHRYLIYMYIEQNNKVYIAKRTDNDIWKGLYQLPLIELPHPIPQHEINQSIALAMGLPEPALTAQLLHETQHQLTHQKLHLTFVSLQLHQDVNQCHFLKNYEAIDKQQLHGYAFPKPLVTFLFAH
jgi:A/G-specific adenine glycosylase